MKIERLSTQIYHIKLNTGQNRTGALLQIFDESGRKTQGDIAPLTGWSKESLESCLKQLGHKRKEIQKIVWDRENCIFQIRDLNLFPSVSFALESALLDLIDPLPLYRVPVAALLMGSCEAILHQSQERWKEGFRVAKLKIGSLTLEEATFLLDQLKSKFYFRIDINCRWPKEEVERFCSSICIDQLDYIEDPSPNFESLRQFQHPFALDEKVWLNIQNLPSFSHLKAVIYKPSVWGGLSTAIPFYRWAQERGVQFVLSSCFESAVGLAHIASMSYRLSLPHPIGLGTYHYLPLTERKRLNFVSSTLVISPEFVSQS